MKSIYVIGSLRNVNIPRIGNLLREEGFDAFDDWYAAGPEADDRWRDYERGRGRSQLEAIRGYAAKHVFSFDLHHLNRCDIGLLVYPAGKSGHLEMGYMRGLGKPCYMLIDGEQDRYDVMVQFANGGVFFTEDDLIEELKSSQTRV